MKVSGILADKGFHAFDEDPHHHQGHKIFSTWFVIADSKNARICRKGKNRLEQIAHAEWGGETWDSFNGHDTRISDGRERKNYDLKYKEKNNDDMTFIHSLAKWLDTANNEHVFDRLVLVADPKTLGHIRENITRNVHDRVTEEIDKDLTKLPLHEIAKQLDHLIVF